MALEKLSHKVYIPYFTQKILEGDLDYQTYVSAKNAHGDITLREAEKVDFIKRYWDFIRDSDAILILNISKNGIENYIGGSTLMEMGFAYGHGKKIYLYNPVPERSERMHYTDEIYDLHPTVINGDLALLGN